MYDSFDKSESAWNFSGTSGDAESPNVGQKHEGDCITNNSSVLSHNENKYKNNKLDLPEELEKFLCYRSCIANNQEMVAQDMAQSYNELFHAAQEPQEIITLEQLSPHGRSLSTSNTSSNINIGSESEGVGHQSHQQQQLQRRTYYNLSALSKFVGVRSARVFHHSTPTEYDNNNG